MATITLNGHPCHTNGSIPACGEQAPKFVLVGSDLNEIKCADYIGKRVVLNIFPSLDTPTCAMSVRRFNQAATSLDNTDVLCVSMDLPFAAARFCVAEGIKNVKVASAFRSPNFGEQYGLKIIDGSLEGLLARAVIVLDGNRKVIYSHLVKEISDEPPYEEAIAALMSDE